MSTARHHAEWLSLLEVSGPFLSMPVLLRTFPQGLETSDPERRAQLRLAYEEWADSQSGVRPDATLHHAWAEWVLRELLGFPGEVLRRLPAAAPEVSVTVAEHGETLRPDWVVQDDDAPARLLVTVVPPAQGLDTALHGARWKSSPATRMMTLLHATGTRLGLVTNGERWMLVDAPRGATTGFVSWYSALWLDEPLTLQAFHTLLGVTRFFGVPDGATLEALLAASASDQQEVTDQLGAQVRRAVELLVRAWDAADIEAGRTLLAGLPEAHVYEAALTVMMRLVFLLAAEERGLLLLDDPLYADAYAVSTLRETLRAVADDFGEELLERRQDAWYRLLATFRAVFGGIRHDRLTLPAYGGSLFDPARFPFLEGWAGNPQGADQDGRIPIAVNNRVVLHLLDALQMLQVKVPGGGPAEARRLSFRALDIEQIGHVYEGLLDHRAARAALPILALVGTREREPEIPLATLEKELAKGEASLLTFLTERTGRTAKSLQKALAAPPDAQRAERLRSACLHDAALVARVRPFAGLVRDDGYDVPLVILPGSLYVTAGTDRRATGTHYTPRSLTEPIVQHTLEPLVYNGPAEGKPRAAWQLRPAVSLLELRICDMAMGSGAFLVQACRFLAERVVEAWEAEQGAMPRPVPDAADPLAVLAGAETDEERLALARRLVAARCLYGVDRNPLAVEMAKLSLWLVTLDRGQPFTFLDHALKAGDSLVGVSLDQLLVWNLEGTGARAFETEGIRLDIEAVSALRREIAATPTLLPEDQTHKARLLAEAEARANHLRTGADLLVGSYFNSLGHAEQGTLRATLLRAFRGGADVPPERAAQADLGDLHPFHWPLEFPEVFSGDGRSGFDTFVGNPPFVGGRRIRETLGDRYRALLYALYPGSSGNADLSAFFFLRGFHHLQAAGTLGLIATNTIAQGDTLETGLAPIAAAGGTIYRAANNLPWPGLAAVVVSVVHLARGTIEPPFVLDEVEVQHISTRLDSAQVTAQPYQLESNKDKSFQGSVVVGMGFVLEPDEAQRLIAQNPRYQEVLFPYLNGEDLNTNPNQAPGRWVINFFDWPLIKAETYTEPMDIVRERVYPVRAKVNREAHRKYWWHYGDKRPKLYATIAPLRRVLVLTIVSKTVAFAFVPANWVYAHRLVVFPLEGSNYFAVLQSAFHHSWAWQYSSTLKQDLNYAPSDCFGTFPFPHPTSDQQADLEKIGEQYHEHRRQVMLTRQQGLTATYNRFHNSDEAGEDIARLRALHVEMDHAVAAAYGWEDLALGHAFHDTAQGRRFTLSEPARREVLARLLALNHARHAEEQANGKAKGKGQRAKGKKDAGDEQLGMGF